MSDGNLPVTKLNSVFSDTWVRRTREPTGPTPSVSQLREVVGRGVVLLCQPVRKHDQAGDKPRTQARVSSGSAVADDFGRLPLQAWPAVLLLLWLPRCDEAVPAPGEAPPEAQVRSRSHPRCNYITCPHTHLKHMVPTRVRPGPNRGTHTWPTDSCSRWLRSSALKRADREHAFHNMPQCAVCHPIAVVAPCVMTARPMRGPTTGCTSQVSSKG